jgi:ComF family protein
LYAPFCSSCWQTIRRYTGPRCRICAVPLSSEYAQVCVQCLVKPPPFSKSIIYGIYQDVLAEAINQMKFSYTRRLARPLAMQMLELDIPEVDGIVPVPLSMNRLRERGFNQSLLIARILSKHKGIPLMMDSLLKKRDTPPQTGLSGKERLKNLKGAFGVRGHIQGLRILLIDDVMTTGATVSECAKHLKRAGAQEVIVMTLARAGNL